MKKFITVLLIATAAIYASLLLLGSPLVPPAYVIESKGDIEAPAQKVWSLLSRFEDYAEWNPYLVNIEGEFSVDNVLAVTLATGNFDKPLTVKPRLTQITPGKAFFWSGKVLTPGIHDTRHFFVIEAIDKDTVSFHQYEEFRGLLALAMRNRKERHAHTQKAFEAMLAAMRQRLESPASSGSG